MRLASFQLRPKAKDITLLMWGYYGTNAGMMIRGILRTQYGTENHRHHRRQRRDRGGHPLGALWCSACVALT